MSLLSASSLPAKGRSRPSSTGYAGRDRTLCLEHRHLRLYLAARQQARHDADLLLRRLARAAAAGRTVGPQRLDFLADQRGLLPVGGTSGDAQTHLVRIVAAARHRTRMQPGDPQDIHAQLLELAAQALVHDLAGKLRTCDAI